ncbi:MAG: DUF3040 domain-containing protein [Actinomycetota bacterium]
MPLSEHEQRILEDIERRLSEDDPRFAETVGSTSLYSHLARRIRWASLAFLAGFALLLLFFVSIWIALAGFVVMLAAALLCYRSLKQLGQDQLRAMVRDGRFSLPGLLARLTGRLPPGDDPQS